MTRITYYDFFDLKYAGFYLKGFQENAREHGYELVVSHAEPPELRHLHMTREWLPKNKASFILFRYEGAGGDSFLFTIDTSDINGDPATDKYDYPLLGPSRYYFKVNYNAQFIAANPILAPHAAKIFPAPVIFPVAVARPWRFRPKLTPLGGPAWPLETTRRRMRGLMDIPSLEQYRRMRETPKDIDAFFIVAIYPVKGREHYVDLNDHRNRIVEGLNKYTRYNIFARYVAVGDQTEGLGPHFTPRLKLSEYLNLMARSRVGIYVRGTFGCLSFKFGELMALGSPVVGETLLNNNEYLYGLDHFAEQFAYDEPEAMVERVIHLLENPAQIDELRRANTNTFLNKLSPKPVVAAILDRLEGRVPAAPPRVAVAAPASLS